ncbi:MAG: hypothetical protein JWL77_6578 [Chthonomonadaceae bacterium]|nr:hypothetical protein [Chthonomonadaceae bacterium]
MATTINSRAFLFAACAGLVAGAHTAHADTTMPPGAFLHQPAPNVAALNRQVQTDRLVAERYARLYGMSPDMVRSAFSKLQLSTLSEDHIYEVHYVHPGEKIGYKLRRVRKGTVIYRMPDGTPALVRVCGNPIRATHPKAVRGAFRRAPEPGQPESALDFQPYEPLEASASPSPVPSPEMRVGEPYTGFVPLTDLPGPTEIPFTPDVLSPATAAATAVHTVSSFAGAAPILGALGALGGVAALAGGSGGGGGGGGGIIIPPGGGGGGVGPAATPEPNAVFLGLALLASSGGILVLRRRKAKRA